MTSAPPAVCLPAVTDATAGVMMLAASSTVPGWGGGTTTPPTDAPAEVDAGAGGRGPREGLCWLCLLRRGLVGAAGARIDLLVTIRGLSLWPLWRWGASGGGAAVLTEALTLT